MTTTTEQALSAAVIARPDQNGPREAYADWCDDNGQPQRGDFIRVQVEMGKRILPVETTVTRGRTMVRFDHGDDYDALRARERELWAMGKPAFPGSFADYDVSFFIDATIGDAYPGRINFVVRRGFVDEVRVPTVASWLGGECVQCVGNNLPPRVPLAGGGSLTCTPCSGTGRTPGIGPAVVAAHPVTRVVPAEIDDGYLESRGGAYWWRDDAVYDHAPRLPTAICPKEEYPTRDLARAALSDALLAAVR